MTVDRRRIMEALARQQAEEDEGDDVLVICQGPPRCHLTGEARFLAQDSDCMWCARIYVDELGKETIVQPGTA